MTMMQALAAPGRAPEIPPEHDVYGWLIGSWHLDVVHYAGDLRGRGVEGEVHFGWVLEGRAVQDVWIMKAEGIVDTYGTTLRVWDAALQAWRVTWVNPITGRRDELIGRRSGNDLVQIGTHAGGALIRWIFSEITDESFRWTGEALNPDGATWKLEAEFHGRKGLTMNSDQSLREQLQKLLDSDHAHVRFDEAVKDFPAALRGKRPEGAPHSAWELLEHLRIAQSDILEFTRDPNHVSPAFPEGYWPSSAAPPSDEAWDASVAAFRGDLRALIELAADASVDLHARIPHGDGQTVLRQLLLTADHNAYHLGQFMTVRRTVGA